MAPVSQKADVRPISFILKDSAGNERTVSLVIRPEDMAYIRPSLLTATQTFDGAWIDDFGPGLATIQLSGHTGWNIGAGWEESFSQLQNAVFDEWHRSRQKLVEEGKSPDEVTLIYADKLDNLTLVCAPNAFTVRRNKSRPLLMMYQVTLTVIGDLSETIAGNTEEDLALTPSGVERLAAGKLSLTDSLGKITSAASRVTSFVDATLANPMKTFMNLTGTALDKVLGAAVPVSGLLTSQAGQFIDIATDLTQVGRNVMQTYQAITSLPDLARYELSTVSAAYNNAFCTLRNAFNGPNFYQDFTDLYGASNCSSTIGGSPLSPLRFGNPFEEVVPMAGLSPGVTAAARQSMSILKATDVLAPMTSGQLSKHISEIANGIRYAA